MGVQNAESVEFNRCQVKSLIKSVNSFQNRQSVEITVSLGKERRRSRISLGKGRSSVEDEETL